jgi:hypothetical protein
MKANRTVGGVVALVALSGGMQALAGVSPTTYRNALTVAASTADLSGAGAGANQSRFGHFSDLWYNASTDTYYALSDRGPGGGLISYEPRFSTFKVDVAPNGAISNFRLISTVVLKQADGVSTFNGLTPVLDTTRPGGADNQVLGRSLDPEGITVDAQGNVYIADEYGPSVLKFNPQGVLVQTFQVPANLTPRDAQGNASYSGTRDSGVPASVVSGRQDNRGYEGLTLSLDGTKLFGVLQDPLAQEGPQAQGRRGQHVRIVEFSVATGQCTAQYVYTLESLADINSRIPGTAQDYTATAQGRNIGLSGITAIGPTSFLVIERDNRGQSVDEAVVGLPVSSKRIYRIDIAGATDVKSIALSNSSNTLPAGVVAVSKTLLIDVAADLTTASVILPEKLEGLCVGPRLIDGRRLLLLGTDNDYSVTQTGAGQQFDVYLNAASQYRYTALDTPSQSYLTIADASAGTNPQGPVPAGFAQVPGYLYAFAASISLPGDGCNAADIACDDGTPLARAFNGCTNSALGPNEGDYNAFFAADGFFFQAGQGTAAIGAFCDIACDNGTPKNEEPSCTNNGVNEGDYNAFFNALFLPCL